MFWINLLPATAAATLICFYFDDEIRADFGTFVAFVFMVFGLTAQVVYFLQFNFARYANNKSLWMYSMVYSCCCILAFLIVAASTRMWGLLWLAVYPNIFFRLSYRSYHKLHPDSQKKTGITFEPR
ncbi:hypothetical protein Mucpa_2847 [Mucilaginibacter paludis DSM 18603]|uniref:Uncharacterized protein n=2 Tax=Mucilaginibacter TaxID=423349 RepID=H1YAB5_9SPHI|nr:hypothetical protein Mucpa_2847 [Mucilaginibacter paludis DSM 18603]